MVWNQSVTRTRWLAVKLTVVALAAIATAGLLSLLLTWWASPLDTMSGNRFGTQAFNARDLTPLGYAAFAFALGVTLGLLIRRTLPAMAATLAIYIVVQILVTAGLRPNLLPATTTTVAVNETSMSQAARIDRSDPATGVFTVAMPAPPGSWIQSETSVLTNAGRPVQDSVIAKCWNLAPGGPAGKGGPTGFGPLGACLAADNLHVDITYQPADHYWPLQWTETGSYLVLAGLLGGACFWRIRRQRG